MLRNLTRIAVFSSAALLALAPAASQQAAAPIARYTMDAGTLSGMAAMGRGGGGIGGMLSMMGGGGNQQAHELILRLGSSRTPTGAAAADHFLPAGAGMGASVPLTHDPRRGESAPEQMEMPRGRLLLFWGCGEHAPAGQPVVIDFARLARGEIPPGLYAQDLNLPDDWRVTPGNSTTYGDWPNGERPVAVPANSSLLGAHRIASTYAPEITFDLAKDFMPALRASGRQLPGGAMNMSWNALPEATGYYAWAFGQGERDRDMVWWTSASTQQFGGPFAEWMSPGTVARHVQAGTVLAPTRTDCTIPAEVLAATGEGFMASLYAYGPQVDFAYPPRPRGRAAWRPEWIARVRFRAMTMMIPGMDMGEGTATTGGEPAGDTRPRCRGGLRGMAERAAGLCQ